MSAIRSIGARVLLVRGSWRHGLGLLAWTGIPRQGPPCMRPKSCPAQWRVCRCGAEQWEYFQTIREDRPNGSRVKLASINPNYPRRNSMRKTLPSFIGAMGKTFNPVPPSRSCENGGVVFYAGSLRSCSILRYGTATIHSGNPSAAYPSGFGFYSDGS
jgi:hypothetical protein